MAQAALGAAAGLLGAALVAALRQDRLGLLLALGGAGLALGAGWAAKRRTRSGNLLQAFLDEQTDGLVILGADGAVLAHNPALARLWRLDAADLANEAALAAALRARLADPGAHPGLAEAWATAPAESRTLTLDLPGDRTFEAQVGPWRQDGRVAGRIWRFRDATARIRADGFVQRLVEAVEQCPVTIVITGLDGSVEFVNPRFTQLTGYDLDEALGMNLRFLQSGQTPRAVYDDLWATVTRGEVWEGEFQNRKKNGEFLFERATIAPLRDDAGVITHYLGLKEDITLQKQLEHRLRHAQKLEAVGLLAGGVAHDFNNILQVINGYGSLMQMTLPAGDPNRKSLEEILNAAERAAQLTHSLLAFSRKQVMNPRVLDLNRVVANVEKFLRRVLGEDVRLRVLATDLDLPVHVDLGLIEQVLLNLATNARDAMPQGGDLTLRTDLVRLDEGFPQMHGFGKPGDYALLEVRDTGRGMDEATLKRIFDPFFTTKAMGHGAGLGLAMVYGTIKQHNGYILADSEPGQGATFRVYLPVAPALGEGRALPALRDGAIKGTETVLLAEDEPAVCAFIETTLRQHGYTVITAGDGQAALEAFRRDPARIDLALMDIIMPRMSGRLAYEEMRRQRPGLRVLFTSGYPADFIRSRGDLGDGLELVMKPVQPLALLRKVREILDRPGVGPSPGPSAHPAEPGSPPPPAAGPV